VLQVAAAVKEYVAYNVNVLAREGVKYLLPPFAAPVVFDIDEIGFEPVAVLGVIHVDCQPTTERLLMCVFAHQRVLAGQKLVHRLAEDIFKSHVSLVEQPEIQIDKNVFRRDVCLFAIREYFEPFVCQYDPGLVEASIYDVTESMIFDDSYHRLEFGPSDIER